MLQENTKMLDWNKAMNEIDFIEYFRYRMPHFYFDTHRKAFVDNNDPSMRSDKFQFFTGKDGRQNYISRKTGNAGNLIHFIKNHVVQGEPNPWKAVNKELLDYQSNLPEIKNELNSRNYIQNITKENINQIFNNEVQDDFIFSGKFYPLHNEQRKYLNNFRKLSDETIDNPLFKDVFKSYKGAKDQYFTLGFEIKDIDSKLVGVQKINAAKDYSNFNDKRFEQGTQNSIGFAFSNRISVDKIHLQSNAKQGGRNLIVTESLIDAASHFEIYQPNNAEYLSTNGELSENKAYLLKQYFEKFAFEKMTLGTDNDLRGSFFDTIILSQMSGNIKINYKDKAFFSASFLLTESETKTLEKLSSLISKIKEIDIKTVDYLSQVLPKDQAKEIIEKEKAISFLKRNGKNEFEFIIPMNKDYLQTFNKMTLDIFPILKNRVSIQKSQTKDWNQDLKMQKENKLSIAPELKKKSSLKI